MEIFTENYNFINPQFCCLLHQFSFYFYYYYYFAEL